MFEPAFSTEHNGISLLQHNEIKNVFKIQALYKQTCTKYTAGPDLQLTFNSHDCLCVVLVQPHSPQKSFSYLKTDVLNRCEPEKRTLSDLECDKFN